MGTGHASAFFFSHVYSLSFVIWFVLAKISGSTFRSACGVTEHVAKMTKRALL